MCSSCIGFNTPYIILLVKQLFSTLSTIFTKCHQILSTLSTPMSSTLNTLLVSISNKIRQLCQFCQHHSFQIASHTCHLTQLIQLIQLRLYFQHWLDHCVIESLIFNSVNYLHQLINCMNTQVISCEYIASSKLCQRFQHPSFQIASHILHLTQLIHLIQLRLYCQHLLHHSVIETFVFNSINSHHQLASSRIN